MRIYSFNDDYYKRYNLLTYLGRIGKLKRSENN